LCRAIFKYLYGLYIINDVIAAAKVNMTAAKLTASEIKTLLLIKLKQIRFERGMLAGRISLAFIYFLCPTVLFDI